MKLSILEIVHIDFDETLLIDNEQKNQDAILLTSNEQKDLLKLSKDLQNKIDIKETLQFLQKIVSNDVLSINCIFTFLLSPKAKYIADFMILIQDNRIFIEIAEQLAQTLINKINLYKIGLKIKIIKTNYCSIFIPKDENIENNLKNIQQFIIAKQNDPRGEDIGVRLITYNNLITQKISEENLTLDLIAKYENNIINYLELDESCNIVKYTNKGFSYKKGCYIGQEVISYAKTTGIKNSNIFKINANLLNLKNNIKQDDTTQINLSQEDIKQNDINQTNLAQDDINQGDITKNNNIDIDIFDILNKEDSIINLKNNTILFKKTYSIYCIDYNLFDTFTKDINYDKIANKAKFESFLIKNKILVGNVLSLSYIGTLCTLYGFCIIDDIMQEKIINAYTFIQMQNTLIPISLSSIN